MFKKSMKEAQAGDNVGILLRGIEREDIERGQVLAAPGTVTPHSEFEAQVYVLSKDADSIPEGAEVMTMSSTTLDQIGLTAELDETEKYSNLKKKLMAMDSQLHVQYPQQEYQRFPSFENAQLVSQEFFAQ